MLIKSPVESGRWSLSVLINTALRIEDGLSLH
jgi:hypothetical protein